jgi:hypothetical protein
MLRFVKEGEEKKPMGELSIIQKVYDLIIWYTPIIERIPKPHRFTLGERIMTNLYQLLEELIYAKYATEKLTKLIEVNARLEVIRYQTRILLDLGIFQVERYDYVNKLIHAIGVELGGWIKQQKSRPKTKNMLPDHNLKST